MTSPFTIILGAPSHAVEPSLLAQRLPRLAQALTAFKHAPVLRVVRDDAVGVVQVYAAQLGVQRDHITLENFPTLNQTEFELLQTRAIDLTAEFAQDGLVFTPQAWSTQDIGLQALGTLNLALALPAAANFIGRDIAHALPRTAEAKVLRQWVNAAQMSLHQSPVAGSAANALWCTHALPSDALSQTWLTSGLTAWWDALPAWDAVLDLSGLNSASELNVQFSDCMLTLPLQAKRAWMVLAKPVQLALLLSDQ